MYKFQYYVSHLYLIFAQLFFFLGFFFSFPAICASSQEKPVINGKLTANLKKMTGQKTEKPLENRNY
jgi:uncharacterized protein YneF (UPF0154 family)